MYSTKKELAEWLAKHDEITLDWLKHVAKEFGPTETFAYIKPKSPINRQKARETAARLDDDEVQSILDNIVADCNTLTKEAKSRYGPRSSLFLAPDGRILMLRDHIKGRFRTMEKLKVFESGRACSLAETEVE